MVWRVVERGRRVRQWQLRIGRWSLAPKVQWSLSYLHVGLIAHAYTWQWANFWVCVQVGAGPVRLSLNVFRFPAGRAARLAALQAELI